MALTDRQKQTILDNLRGKIRNPCPRCSQGNFTLGDEVVATTTTSLQGGMAVGGPIIPMVQAVCTNCGFVSHHAIGVLGIDLQ